MNSKKIFRNEKGSTTIFVLLSLLFFLLVLSTYYIKISNKILAQEKQYEKVKEEYFQNINMEKIYENIIANEENTQEIKPSKDGVTDSAVDIITDYGLIDIIWLRGKTNMVSSIPNQPNLFMDTTNPLTPVTWTYYKNGTTDAKGNKVNWIEDTNAKSTWYNYTAEKGTDGKEDNITSMWANAKNSDGSYFVWIPRYAYRITYYSDASYTNVTGYYDGYGMWRAGDGSKKYDLDAKIETVLHNGKRYIVHPAFETNLDNGGWSEDLTGLWVAKYEMSRKGATASNAGSGYSTTFLSVPNVRSARTITIGNIYQVSLKYDTTKESHMIKNSEWGAVAYLTHSQYGRNGHELDINNSSTFITGNGGGAIGSKATIKEGTTYAYNTTTGAKASSTGNVYGIYDLSGGAYEYVAVYNKKGNKENLETTTYGLNMTKNAKDTSGNYISTKYITAYNNNSDDYSSEAKMVAVSRIGDSIKEVRKTSESKGWFADNSTFARIATPFFTRGGGYDYGDTTGIFYSGSYSGKAGDFVSFRMVLSK